MASNTPQLLPSPDGRPWHRHSLHLDDLWPGVGEPDSAARRAPHPRTSAETFETQELILEGVLAIVDTEHPSVIRMRLASFSRASVPGAKTQWFVDPSI